MQSGHIVASRNPDFFFASDSRFFFQIKLIKKSYQTPQQSFKDDLLCSFILGGGSISREMIGLSRVQDHGFHDGHQVAMSEMLWC